MILLSSVFFFFLVPPRIALPLSQGFFGSRSTVTCTATGGLDGPRTKVLVTGAGGRTGSLVFKKLQTKANFQPIGLVRSSKSADKLKKSAGATDDQVWYNTDECNSHILRHFLKLSFIFFQIVIGSVMDPEALAKACAGCESMILCTSATPKVGLDSSLSSSSLISESFRFFPSFVLHTKPIRSWWVQS